jgi:hypothetical protein
MTHGLRGSFPLARGVDSEHVRVLDMEGIPTSLEEAYVLLSRSDNATLCRLPAKCIGFGIVH